MIAADFSCKSRERKKKNITFFEREFTNGETNKAYNKNNKRRFLRVFPPFPPLPPLPTLFFSIHARGCAREIKTNLKYTNLRNELL